MIAELGQLLWVGLSGPELTTEEKKFLVENRIAGVVLFARNLQTPEQLHALCSELQSLRKKIPDARPFFIAIDMEGGRIAQLKEPFTQWPPLKLLGDLDSPTTSFHFAYKMGLELRAFGINTDFAPCVDIFSNPRNTVIGDRSIGTHPDLVSKHASALIRGYLKAGVLPCSKHFPGHGNTLVDSHEDLPVENANLDRLRDFELVPFAKSIKSRVPFIMTGHLSFPEVDPEWPVTLSEIFLKKIAREELRYRGLMVADDLDMLALAKHFGADEIPVRSVNAGIDLLLYCNNLDSPPRVLELLRKAFEKDELSKERVQESVSRILEVKRTELQNCEPLPLNEALNFVGPQEHRHLAQDIREGRAVAAE